jgi:hypothetical protein
MPNARNASAVNRKSKEGAAKMESSPPGISDPKKAFNTM